MSQFDIHAVNISFCFFHAINFASGIPYEYRFPSYLDRKYFLKGTFFIHLPWVSRWQSSLNYNKKVSVLKNSLSYYVKG